MVYETDTFILFYPRVSYLTKNIKEDNFPWADWRCYQREYVFICEFSKNPMFLGIRLVWSLDGFTLRWISCYDSQTHILDNFNFQKG